MPFILDSVQEESVLDVRKLPDVVGRVVGVVLAAQVYTGRFDDAPRILDELGPGASPFRGLGVLDLKVVCVAGDRQLWLYVWWDGTVLPHFDLSMVLRVEVSFDMKNETEHSEMKKAEICQYE